jgi:hypothetical protein
MRSLRLWTLLIPMTLLAACVERGHEAEQVEVADTEAAQEPMAFAQPECAPSPDMGLEGRESPYDSTTIAVGEGQAKVCYGRPSLRGRTMIGGEAVPYDTLWRTGANEATTVHLNVPARIAGLEVEPGSYSLYTIPHEGAEWTLIVNRSTEQWGIESEYSDEVRAQEVGRAPVRAEEAESPIELFTIRPADGGLVMEWQHSRVFVSVEPAAG